MPKHTPTPWHTHTSVDQKQCLIVDDENWVVARITRIHADCSIEEAEANADLIVRAVNSHDALVSAMTPVHVALNDAADFGAKDWNPDAHVEITLTIAEARAIRASLNLAKGIK